MTETSQNIPPLPMNTKRFETLTPGPQENPAAPASTFSARTSAQTATEGLSTPDWFDTDDYKENAHRL